VSPLAGLSGDVFGELFGFFHSINSFIGKMRQSSLRGCIPDCRFCLNCDFYDFYDFNDSIGGKHQANMNLAAAES
jgi:hypothetical protein